MELSRTWLKSGHASDEQRRKTKRDLRRVVDYFPDSDEAQIARQFIARDKLAFAIGHEHDPIHLKQLIEDFPGTLEAEQAANRLASDSPDAPAELRALERVYECRHCGTRCPSFSNIELADGGIRENGGGPAYLAIICRRCGHTDLIDNAVLSDPMQFAVFALCYQRKGAESRCRGGKCHEKVADRPRKLLVSSAVCG